MNIIILGAGTVGSSIAEILCANKQNVSLVDHSRLALDHAEERLDVQTICGSACDAITLFQAGVQSSDLCLAVTTHDEANLVSASLARAMGSRRSVARVFNPAYRNTSTFDYQRHFNIDRLLSLEQLSAIELSKHVRQSSLVPIENFARGEIEVQSVVAGATSKAVGVPLRDLTLSPSVRLALIAGPGRTIIPSANDAVMSGDEVTLVGCRGDVEDARSLFEPKAPRRLNIVIAGGGEIGFNLAALLEKLKCNVVLMEADAARCEFVAGNLTHTTVLHADVTRRSEMEEARVGKADIFVAATGRDEDNIVCGVEARELGAKRILSIVRRPDYGNVLGKLGIDVAVSPREAMARQILGMVASGPIIGRFGIGNGAAEIWEIEVAADTPITTAPLREITFNHSLVAAIERENFVKVPGADDQLKAGDTAIVLVQKETIDQTLALFLPGPRES